MVPMEIKTTLSRGYENDVNTGRLDCFGESKAGMACRTTLLLCEDHVDICLQAWMPAPAFEGCLSYVQACPVLLLPSPSQHFVAIKCNWNRIVFQHVRVGYDSSGTYAKANE